MRYFLYALTLVTSSALLFVVQPMVAKMVQPVLGGTPAVWNTAMVFFQALLLAGYLYAHLTTRWLGTRRQALLHLVVMLAGLAFLPIAFEAPADPTAIEGPAFWLLATLLLAVGWPFFVVSTSAPLLQKWFSTIDHRRASDPYHLYAASNTGSILALIAYPFFIEPRIGLAAQSLLWTAAYLVLCAAVAICAALLWTSPPPTKRPDDASLPPASHQPIDRFRRARWVLWAFIPSTLMLSVTTFITTDIAPVPLLWVLPLAIYILSFIAAFARHRPIPLRWWLYLFAPALAGATAVLATDTVDPLWAVTAITVCALLVLCMTFHGLLATDRPHTDGLTEFYLWIAVGGVLGGVFNALVAPAIFDRLLEYPFALLLAALAIPNHIYGRPIMRRICSLSLLGAGLYVAFALVGDDGSSMLALIVVVAAVIGALLALLRKPNWTPLVLGCLVALVAADQARPDPGELFAARSFFGTHQVLQSSSGTHHVLYHGRTIHGAQSRTDEFRGVPLTYYYYSGPLGQLTDHLSQRDERHPIAAIGLGTGAIATYLQPRQSLDIFEIDPTVYHIASNPDYFTYLTDCRGVCDVHIGDGRLLIDGAEDERYELIVVDAFSSTAIPVHLLTREALEIYMRKLRPDGLLAIHISNPYLDLEPPLTQAAEDLGLASRIQEDLVDDNDPRYQLFVDSSEWMIFASSQSALGSMAADQRWLDLEPHPDFEAWTDDYANILKVYRW